MQEYMARLQFRSSYYEKVGENHFEDWILDDQSFKDNKPYLIDYNPSI